MKFAEVREGDVVRYDTGAGDVTFAVENSIQTILPDGVNGSCTWVAVNRGGAEPERFCVDQDWNPILEDRRAIGKMYRAYWGSPVSEIRLLLALWPAGKELAPGSFYGLYFGAPIDITVAAQGSNWVVDYSITFYSLAGDEAEIDRFSAIYARGSPWPTRLRPFLDESLSSEHRRVGYEQGHLSHTPSSALNWNALRNAVQPMQAALPHGSGCDNLWIDSDTILNLANQDPLLKDAMEHGVVTRLEAFPWSLSGPLELNGYRRTDIRVFHGDVVYPFRVEQTSNSLGPQEPTLTRYANEAVADKYERPPASIGWCDMVSRLAGQTNGAIQITHEPPSSTERLTLVPGMAWGDPGWLVGRIGGGNGRDVSLTTGFLIGTPP